MSKKEYRPPASRQLELTSIVAQIGPIQSQQYDKAAHAPLGKDEKLDDRWNDDFMAREWDDWEDWEEE